MNIFNVETLEKGGIIIMLVIVISVVEMKITQDIEVEVVIVLEVFKKIIKMVQ